MSASAQDTARYRNLDENGVDLTNGDFVMAFKEGSIGSGKAALPLVRRNASPTGGSRWDALAFQRTNTPVMAGNQEVAGVVFADQTTSTFTRIGTGAFDTAKANGSFLSGSGDRYLHTAADGTVILFGDPTGNPMGSESNFCRNDNAQYACTLVPLSITDPDGSTVTLEYDTAYRSLDDTTFPPPVEYYWRLRKVSNSHGYSVTFTYSDNNDYSGSQPPAAWYQRTGAEFRNETLSSAVQASVGYAYPAAGAVDVTDMAGSTWRITSTSIRRPGESSPSFALSGSIFAVTGVTRDGVTTSYSRSVSGSTATMVKTDALSNATTIVSDLTKMRPISVTDALGKTTSIIYDAYGRLTRITRPEGNYQEVTLDGRGNATQIRAGAKSGSGLPDITASATFDTTCLDPSCNLPNSTTDARGKTTDFTYNTTHGGVTAATAPSPDGAAPRPEVRTGYSLINGEYLLTSTSACQTSASCAAGADEVKATIAYDANRNVTSVSKGAGDGSLTATTAMTYTAMGDAATVDGPLAGTDDTARYRYDAARRLVGIITADPDGSGPLKRRAERRGYDAAGRLTTIERGTVTGTDDTAWAAFVPAEKVTTSWTNGRKAKDVLSSGGTDYAVTQYSYDAVGRVECVAVRMNPATWSSLPSSACTLATTGSAGPDRITRYSYDAAGRQTKVQTGYGVSGVQADDVTTTYTDNGQVASVTDAEGNRTTYEYDGHDRLKKTRYPSPVQGSGTSSTTDYEELGYDAGSNVTSRRLRDGQVHNFTYDNLNRVTLKDVPNSVAHEYDVSYAYDNFGRLKQALDSGTHVANFSYDALGRLRNEQSNWTTRSFQYDAAGRRTRLTWGDGFYVTYDYDLTGAMTAIKENGSVTLASFGYDDLGRRSSLTRGNGTVTSYGYDPVSRLSSLTHDLAGTAHDVTTSFAHNPASQIASSTRSNDAYAWGGHYNVDRPYGGNGLNQLTSAGATGLSYDGRGNLTNSGSNVYSYTSENRLATAPGDYVMTYDPVGRYHWISNGGPLTWMQYDGASIIEERDGSGVLRRYVHGPGLDEPLVWYEGPGTSDKRWLHADERGSIVAVSNGAGSVLAVNSYDEYGIPASGNIGRFGYTGQAWLPEFGMWYYKARIYSPTLGRFMQTDPIGYGGGLNLYNYVGGDPVNKIDPLGLQECIDGGTGDDCEVVVKGEKEEELSPWFPFWWLPGGVWYFPLPESSVNGGLGSDEGEIVVVARSQRDNPACTSGRYTLGGQYSATGFLATFGVSGNIEVGVALPTRPSNSWNPFAGVQLYARGQGLGLAGLGFFAGAGVSAVGGINSGPLKTGVETTVGAQGGLAIGAGGEGGVSFDPNSGSFGGVSVSGGPRAGAGGYLAGSAGKSATLATAPLGCR